MTSYIYQPLESSSNSFRLITLHPRLHNDVVRISITHSPLTPLSPSHTRTMSRKELETSIPVGWSICETIEGRILFHHVGDDGEERTSWHHPDPSMNPRDYASIERPESLAARPHFEALSYTWESQRNCIDVEVVASNAQSDGQADAIALLKIGANLHDALRHLRSASPRTLWVDAVCINQDDMTERSEQVGRMELIYKYATRVIVWLGSSSSDSTLALRTLEYMGRQIEYTSSYTFIPTPDANEKEWWKPKQRIQWSDGESAAIASLVQRSWFERLWVVQEIQLANRRAIIKCGDTEVLWYHLRRAFIKCRSNTAGLPEFSSPSMRARVMHLWYLSTDLTNSRSRVLLRIAMDCKCTDPRDKVYALLGLFAPTLAQRIRPQYALPVSEVYIQLVLASIEATKRLSLLGPMQNSTLRADLPSWVPDLSAVMPERQRVPWVSASGSSAAHAKFVYPDQLHLIGVLYGKVTATSASIPADLTLTVQIARDCWESGSSALPYPTGETVDSAQTWALASGRLRDRWRDFKNVPGLETATDLLQGLHDGQVPGQDHPYRAWIHETCSRLQGKKFFRCEEGYIGYGDKNILKGDRVCVFMGSLHPAVLRPVHPGRFRNLGKCYVHGIMDAQAVLGPIESPWQATVRRAKWTEGVPTLVQSFFNRETGEETRQDPRLEQLPEVWETLDKEDDTGLGMAVQHYRHRETGEVYNSDPKLFPDALRARGLDTQTICLV